MELFALISNILNEIFKQLGRLRTKLSGMTFETQRPTLVCNGFCIVEIAHRFLFDLFGFFVFFY